MDIQQLDKFRIPSDFRGKSIWMVQLWWIVQATLFRGSPQFMYGWRNFLLRIFGARIGKGVIIRPTVKITYPWKLTVGNYSWIGDDVDLYTLGEIRIGSNSVISQKCYLCTGTHDYKDPNFAIFSREIIIGDSCWLATDVFVAPGIKIIDGAIIGSRSSVYKNIDAQGIYFGNPAEYKKAR